MVSIPDAIAFAALADNPNANITLPNGWFVEPGPQGTILDQYSVHGLTYNIYVNSEKKQIVISFGDDINSLVGNFIQQYSEGSIINAVLQLGVSPSTLSLMNDAAGLTASIFSATQPGYTNPSTGTQWGNSLQGYTVFVTGSGRGGTAAEYAVQQVLSQFPIAQTNKVISGIAFGDSGISGVSSDQSGVDFTSYVLGSDIFALSPLVPNHLGTTVILDPTNQDYINDIVVPALESFIPEGKLIKKISEEVINKASDNYIVGNNIVNYANALIQSHIITYSPLGQFAPISSSLNFNLKSVFSGIQNYSNAENVSSTVAEQQSGSITYDGVTEGLSLDSLDNGNTNLLLADSSGSDQATEETEYDFNGNVLSNKINIIGSSINTTGSESQALASSVDGSLIVVFSPDIAALGDFELIANPDGTSDFVGVNTATGEAQEVAGFAAGGLSGDEINIAENSDGIISVDVMIGTSSTTELTLSDPLPDIEIVTSRKVGAGVLRACAEAHGRLRFPT